MSDPRLQPAFVMIGPLRAGTTLLRLLMSNHPRIAAIGEFEEAVSRAGDGSWPDASWFRTWLSQDRAAQAKNYGELPWDRPYPDIVRSMWAQLASRETKPFVTCSIHSRFDRLREIWPDVKFVFLVRDPRDVARSCVGMGWAGEPTHGAAYWLEPTQRWLAMRDRIPSSDYVEVRYEDLLTDPETTLDRCCQLIDEQFDRRMLNFHESSTYQPLDPSLAFQWKLKASRREAELIELACGDLLDEYGYERSPRAPKPAGSIERMRLRLHNRIGRLRWRCDRYGLGLTLRWAVVKRMSIESKLRSTAQQQINAIDRKHLK